MRNVWINKDGRNRPPLMLLVCWALLLLLACAQDDKARKLEVYNKTPAAVGVYWMDPKTMNKVLIVRIEPSTNSKIDTQVGHELLFEELPPGEGMGCIHSPIQTCRKLSLAVKAELPQPRANVVIEQNWQMDIEGDNVANNALQSRTGEVFDDKGDPLRRLVVLNDSRGRFHLVPNDDRTNKNVVAVVEPYQVTGVEVTAGQKFRLFEVPGPNENCVAMFICREMMIQVPTQVSLKGSRKDKHPTVGVMINMWFHVEYLQGSYDITLPLIQGGMPAVESSLDDCKGKARELLVRADMYHPYVDHTVGAVAECLKDKLIPLTGGGDVDEGDQAAAAQDGCSANDSECEAAAATDGGGAAAAGDEL